MFLDLLLFKVIMYSIECEPPIVGNLSASQSLCLIILCNFRVTVAELQLPTLVIWPLFVIRSLAVFPRMLCLMPWRFNLVPGYSCSEIEST